VTRLNAAIAAVCPIDGVSVGTIGDPATVRIDYRPEATTEQRAAAQAALAAFDWNRDPMIWPYDFLDRFTNTELTAIQTSVDANVIRFRTKIQTMVSQIDLDHSDTIGGLGHLTLISILAPGRAEAIRGL
jgi:hypothetical protein